jgi:hypothetical protein
MKNFREEKWLKTPDDWYPTYEEGKVKASFMPLSDGLFRVSVWGADDFGIYRDFKSRMEAKMVFGSLPDPITQKHLYALGFERF